MFFLVPNRYSIVMADRTAEWATHTAHSSTGWTQEPWAAQIVEPQHTQELLLFSGQVEGPEEVELFLESDDTATNVITHSILTVRAVRDSLQRMRKRIVELEDKCNANTDHLRRMREHAALCPAVAAAAMKRSKPKTLYVPKHKCQVLKANGEPCGGAPCAKSNWQVCVPHWTFAKSKVLVVTPPSL